MRPFVKWAGGKSQLLPQIRTFYPESCEKYAEPFVGGGAVLFDVLQTLRPAEVYISDANRELINTYMTVRDHVSLAVDEIKRMQYKYNSADKTGQREYFNKVRDLFNREKMHGYVMPSIEMAARFIFLNKTCFNGLYRVNKSGKFNVPLGNYVNPSICDEENLIAVSHALQGVDMNVGDYRLCDSFVDSRTFVYFDPPYRPLTTSSGFTSYTNLGFGDQEQIELAAFAKQLSDRGARVLLSNSDPTNVNPTDTFFDKLYEGFDIQRTPARRSINSRGDVRTEINELLIYRG